MAEVVTLEQLVSRSRLLASERRPTLIAVDGRSGVGKTSLTQRLADAVDGLRVDQDDFYSGGSKEAWDARSPQQKYDLVIDWHRVRREALEPLLAGQAASYHPFNWETMEGLATHTVDLEPRPIIVLDGAYSTRPELLDLVALTALVVAPNVERRQRLLAREGDEYMADWHARWDEAEEYYFTQVRPSDSFDMIIENRDPGR